MKLTEGNCGTYPVDKPGIGSFKFFGKIRHISINYPCGLIQGIR